MPLPERGDRTRAGLAGETAWRFANSVLREVAAVGVVEPEFGDLHGRIAAHMLDGDDYPLNNEAGVIAHHLQLAGDVDEAGEMYLVAGECALGSMGGGECLRLADRALSCLEVGTENYRGALELKESALALLGRQEERREILDELLEQLELEGGSVRRRLQVRGRVIRLHYELGDLDAVEREAAALVEDARDAGEQHVVGSALRQLHMVHRDRGEHGRALEILDEVDAVFRARADPEGTWAALVSRGICLRQAGRLGEALPVYEAALAIVSDAGLHRQEQNTRTNLGVLFANLGEYDRARQNYSLALGLARERGYIRDEAATLANQGHLLFMMGHEKLAEEKLSRAVQLSRTTQDQLVLSDALLSLGLVHGSRKHLRKASALVRKGAHIAAAIGHRYLEIHGAICEATVALQNLETDGAGALAAATRAAQMGRERGLAWAIIRGTSLTSEAHWRGGDLETAFALSLAATEQLRETEMEGAESVWARHARIATAVGDPSAEVARARGRALVERIGASLSDAKTRARYLRSGRVKAILES